MSILSQAHYHDDAAAFAKLESIVWPNGAVCPHCGGAEKIYRIKPNPEKRVRHGLRKCGHCRKQFTATVGTIFEGSKIPLHKWFQAAFLMTSSKKGISSNQLARTLDVTVKTAWFMSHRLREAMRGGELDPMSGIVEVDETFIGHDSREEAARPEEGPGLCAQAQGADAGGTRWPRSEHGCGRPESENTGADPERANRPRGDGHDRRSGLVSLS